MRVCVLFAGSTKAFSLSLNLVTFTVSMVSKKCTGLSYDNGRYALTGQSTGRQKLRAFCACRVASFYAQNPLRLRFSYHGIKKLLCLAFGSFVFGVVSNFSVVLISSCSLWCATK
jgi:hypothetical protein